MLFTFLHALTYLYIYANKNALWTGHVRPPIRASFRLSIFFNNWIILNQTAGLVHIILGIHSFV